MEFGKVSPADLPQIDFTLKALPAQSLACLQHSSRVGKATLPAIYVGCPVWANKEWIGTWYPIDAKERDFLKHYAQLFSTIELNSTHYQIPHPHTVERWREQVSSDFRFCPKFPQEISHTLLPSGKSSDLTTVFCQNMQLLGECLGTSFLQLPPTFAPKDVDYLWKFYDALPADYPLAVEFRHVDWFKKDYLPMAAARLSEYGIGTVITDTAGRRDAVHLVLSTAMLMLRFVGNDLHATDYSRIDAWIQKIQTLLEAGIQTIYLFAHEPDNTLAPELACYMLAQLGKVCQIHLPIPQPIQQAKQMGLF